MLYRQFFHFFVYVPTIQLIFSVSYLRILKFLSVVEIYNKMSEIQNFWLLALTDASISDIHFTDASISDIHTYVKVYTSCQYGAFFTKCTILSLIRPTINSISSIASLHVNLLALGYFTFFSLGKSWVSFYSFAQFSLVRSTSCYTKFSHLAPSILHSPHLQDIWALFCKLELVTVRVSTTTNNAIYILWQKYNLYYYYVLL
jgi:uncharacterized membrane protein YvlD (DUF360 family)